MSRAERAAGRPSSSAAAAPGGRFGFWMAIAVAVVAGLTLLLALFTQVAGEPLRRRMESDLNHTLKGYTVHVGALRLRPLDFGVSLRDVTLSQTRNPKPPVAHIERLDAGVQWRALVHARIVADFVIERPVLHVTRRQSVAEATDNVPVRQRGWQEALRAIYPLKINEFVVRDGALTYVDEGPFEPLRVTDIQLVAGNIRNVRSKAGEYPSNLRFTAVLFGASQLRADGDADFLAEPHPGVRADVDLQNLPLGYLAPVVRHYNLDLRSGSLSTRGRLEYAPTVKVASLEELTLRGVHADYVHRADTAAAESQRAERVAQTARDVQNRPGVLLKARHVTMAQSELGFVNQSTTPEYRLFLVADKVSLENFSNQLREGTAVADVQGRFMASGHAQLNGTFRPEQAGPDFDMAARIEGADVPALNDVLRAYGGFDVAGGTLSVYSEMSVHDGMVRGYVKPIVKDLDVYDPQQEAGKGVLKKAYEGLVAGAAEVLKNHPRDQLATEVDFSGPVANPKASTFAVALGLVENAFLKAVLPGLKGQLGTTGAGGEE